MAIIQRFSTIRRGGIIFTGNTAGLAPVNASGGRYGTRHGVGRIFGKCDTCAHLQSVVAVVGHQPCRLDACGGLRGLLAAASQSDSVVRSVGGFAGRRQYGHTRRGVRDVSGRRCDYNATRGLPGIIRTLSADYALFCGYGRGRPFRSHMGGRTVYYAPSRSILSATSAMNSPLVGFSFAE